MRLGAKCGTELASGASSVSINILGANLGITFVADITPSSSYADT